MIFRQIRRLKRLYELSKKDLEVLSTLENLTEAQLQAIPEVVEGDGNAVFIGAGTEEEYIKQQKEDDGTLPWIERLKNL